MQKLVLISILIATFVVPAVAARERRPAFALRKAAWWMLAAIGLYVLALMFVYPRLLG